VRRKRIWQPRPSEDAAAAILAAVRAVLATDDEAGGLTTGFGFSIKQLSERAGLPYTHSTLSAYVCHLAAVGRLVRVSVGVYSMPRRRA